MATPGALDSNGAYQDDVEGGQVEMEVKEAGGEGEEPPTMSDKLFRQQLGPYRKEPTVYSRWGTLLLAYQTLGIVYGDLGTSPLYVYPTISINDPQEADFLGVLSLIFWTLTLIGLFKYVFIVLRANDHGEGGTFAVYSLLCQHANIGQNAGEQYRRHASDARLRFYSKAKESKTKQLLENSPFLQKALLFLVMVGTCMVIGDGVLTPAISVLSSVVGIRSADPSFNQTKVIGVSVAILLVLFLCQRFGTSRVSFLFSPIMVAWFLTTPIIGVYNIVKYYPGVLKALSPHYIYLFFYHNKTNGWMMLQGVVLAITGAEAMFCDLSHFNMGSIQLAFSGFVYPSLILTYAGQTAYLIRNPGDMGDAFFKSLPKPIYWPMFVVATLAAIVASQALISATFTIVKQSMALGCFPRVNIRHTSQKQEGQVYSPEMNYTLMVLCIAVVIGFREGTQIGNAFGVAVICVMFITSILMVLVELIIWRLPWPIVVLFFSIFGSIECVYLSSVLQKVPQGGWVPFAIAFVFLSIMLSWNYGRQKKHHYEMNNKVTLESLGALLSNSATQRVPGVCFFYSDLVHGVAPIVPHYVRNVRTLHQILVFITIRYLPVRTVLPEERMLVGRLGYKGVYRCIARYGYMDVINLQGHEFMDQVIQNMQKFLQSEDTYNITSANRTFPHLTSAASPTHDNGCNTENGHNMENEHLEEMNELNFHATHSEPVYVLGKTMLESGIHRSFVEQVIVNNVYRFLKMICRPAIQALKIPPRNYLEVGMLYEL